MKTYPKMKETSIPWLGKIPEHWEVKRLKYCAPLTTEKCTESKDDAIALENIESWTGRLIYTESTFESDGISYRKGDVLFGKLRPYLAKVFLAEKEGEAVGDVFVLRPNVNATPGYVAHSLRTTNFIDTINASTYGSKMPRVSWNFMGNLAFPLPPLPEQQAIATYLDKATAKIDALIAEQEKLCTLLAEKRKALISHVVTKGLDPKAKLKPSGISWLGDIPEHWEVKKGRYLGTLFGSVSPADDELIEDDSVQDGDLPFAKVDDLNQVDATLKLTSTKARVRGYRARLGTFLLFPKRGAAIFTNKVALVEKPLLFDPNLMGWQINSSFAVKFYAYCLIARRLDDLADVSTVPQINNKHIYPAAFPCPPLTEQQAIAAYLDKATVKLDALAAKAEEGIALLKERRSALISEVVTGKVRVA